MGIIKARAFVKINMVYNLTAKELNSTESRQYIDLALGSHHQLSHDMPKSAYQIFRTVQTQTGLLSFAVKLKLLSCALPFITVDTL